MTNERKNFVFCLNFFPLLFFKAMQSAYLHFLVSLSNIWNVTYLYIYFNNNGKFCRIAKRNITLIILKYIYREKWILISKDFFSLCLPTFAAFHRNNKLAWVWNFRFVQLCRRFFYPFTKLYSSVSFCMCMCVSEMNLETLNTHLLNAL